MTFPNFLIIGAAKSGTTALYHGLKQHPDVYMSPVKEPRYFAPEFYRTNYDAPLRDSRRKQPMTLEAYTDLFEAAGQAKAIGEASTEYLYFPETPQRIKTQIPKVKLVAVLRNPVERAFSAYCYQMRDGCAVLPFEEAIEAEPKRIKQNWRPGWLYLKSGDYLPQLERYYRTFDSSQIKVYLYDELRRQPQRLYRDLFSFLEVDPTFEPELAQKNVSKMPASQSLNRLKRRLKVVKPAIEALLPETLVERMSAKLDELNMRDKPELNQELRETLSEHFSDDVMELQDLIGKDLSLWLN